MHELPNHRRNGVSREKPLLRLVNLVKDFGDVRAVDSVSLDVYPGELVTFLGPSGCGKTTLLRMIGGFTRPTSGQIRMEDSDITSKRPYERATCMVFQNYALFPHLDVFHNVAYGLQVARLDRNEIRQRVARLLRLVRLEGYERRRPHELSGGQQQRVALARALALEPQVLLLDEPFSSLDANLRVQMREELRQLQRRLQLTVLFVTHDQEEAMSISDRILVMREGRVQQLGTPREVYETPVNSFVAQFLGRVNLLPGRMDARQTVRCGPMTLAAANGALGNCRDVLVVLRPEMLQVEPDAEAGDGGAPVLTGEVETVQYLGASVQYTVATRLGPVTVDVFSSNGAGTYSPGDKINIRFPERAHVIPAAAGPAGRGGVVDEPAAERIPESGSRG